MKPQGHQREKRLLKKKGWSNRQAAHELGLDLSHFSRVLNGHRESARLLKAIHDLPAREVAVAR